MKYGYGIDLGGTTVKIAFFDETGLMHSNWEIPTVTADGGRQILPDIAASVLRHLELSGMDREQIIGIGIGVPGPVDNNGVVNKCVNLGWEVFNIEQALSQLTGFPVKGGNDANVAALGEFWKGGGEGCQNMVFATLGTGVGGGIVIDGKLLYGSTGSGAEIGHMLLNRDETRVCGCGNRGCVEQYCSATGIVRLAQDKLEATDAPSLLRQGPVTAKAIFDGGKAGDVLALEVLEQYYTYMGEFTATLCSVINPEVFVLGGGVSKAGDMLIKGIEPHFHKHVFHAAGNVRFVLASLGNDAGAYGAFKLALDAFG